MKLALIADPHVANYKRWGGEMIGGVNARGRLCLDVLCRCCKQAAAEGCTALVVLGDLFDNVRPSPQLVRATAEALTWGGPTYVLIGNHDLSTSSTNDHAAASLALAPNIHVAQEPTLWEIGGEKVLAVPYRDGQASGWLPEAMGSFGDLSRQGVRVALTHVGIWDDDTPAYMRNGRDVVGLGQARWLCDAHKLKFLVAGNWHASREWPVYPPTDSNTKLGLEHERVVIPGTICPNGFHALDHKGYYGQLSGAAGCFTVVETGTAWFARYDIPGPRWITARGISEIDSIKIPDRGYTYFLRAVVSPRHVAEATEWLTDIARRGSHSVGGWCVETSESTDFDLIGGQVQFDDPVKAVEAQAAEVEVKEPGTREGVVKRLDQYRKAAT